MKNTSAAADLIITLIQTIDEAVRLAGPDGIPSGHLYAMLISAGIDLATYERLLGILIEAGQIRREDSHLLVWIGKVR